MTKYTEEVIARDLRGITLGGTWKRIEDTTCKRCQLDVTYVESDGQKLSILTNERDWYWFGSRRLCKDKSNQHGGISKRTGEWICYLSPREEE